MRRYNLQKRILVTGGAGFPGSHLFMFRDVDTLIEAFWRDVDNWES
jgi:nucleoside-diphosphate-sugar epimerase